MPSEIELVVGEPEDQAGARVLARLQKYVEIETPSRNEAAIQQLANLVAKDLEAAGGNIEIAAAPGYGAQVIAHFAGETNDAHLVLLAHMDTVHPVGTIRTQPFLIKADRAEGPGIYDMKAGFALAIEAMSLLKRKGARPRRPVRFVLTCDEEIGTHASLATIEAHARGAAAVLVPEPCNKGGHAKTQRKGVLTYRLDVTGRAAHAGVAPQTGINAIVEMGKQIERLYSFAKPELGTTVNVGVIAGGTASNVVAANATAEIDVRVINMEEWKRIDAAFMAITPINEGAQVVIRQSEQRPPLERTPAVVELYEKARALATQLGREMGEGLSGGGSDGSLTAAMGVPTLDGLGADGGGAHAADEHILIADLPYRLALFTRIFETF